MTRSALLAALALGLAGSASAQTTPAERPVAPADSAVADSMSTAIAPDEDRARELYTEGLAEYRAQNYEAALAKYDEALLYGESLVPAALGRGQALYNLSRFDDARIALEAAVAMARASDASNAPEVVKVAEQWLDTTTAAIESRAANEQAQAASAASEERDGKVARAIEMLSANEVSMAQATDAYALLEQARMAGFNPNSVAFYYATALIAMERGEDAIPYAETALETGEGDQSGTYILLGRAHLAAGHADEARAAFESIQEGQAWHGWVPHYLSQVEALEAGPQG